MMATIMRLFNKRNPITNKEIGGEDLWLRGRRLGQIMNRNGGRRPMPEGSERIANTATDSEYSAYLRSVACANFKRNKTKMRAERRRLYAI